jgi:hypothetical protein
MQTAAMIRRFLIGYSSHAGFVDSEIVVSGRAELIQRIVASCLTETVYSQEALLKLTNTLIHLAELAYALRDVDALQEMSRVLMNLPIDGARQIGLYYKALVIKRTGRIDEAQPLLEIVADNAPVSYRARAIQTLGATHFDKGLPEPALRFQLEALQVASDKNAHGLQTILLANLEISHVKSDTGDHKGALAILEGIAPLVRLVAGQNPLYFYFYHNELAVEFGELNRIAEAEAASAIALASPFAPAYPEWSETRQELQAKRTSATPSVVAVNQTSEVIPAPRMQPQPCLKPKRVVAFCWLTSNKTSVQTTLTTIARFRAIADGRANRNTLDQLGKCIRSRAPPTRA